MEKLIYILGLRTNYTISDKNGVVKNIVTGRTIKPRIATNGYLMIHLSVNKRKMYVTVHKLVALTFIGEKPFPNYQVNHKDGNKLNNDVDNLEWVSPKYNTQHAIENALTPLGEDVYNCKYSDDLVFIVCCHWLIGRSVASISKEYNIPKQYVRNIVQMRKRKNIMKSILKLYKVS